MTRRRYGTVRAIGASYREHTMKLVKPSRAYAGPICEMLEDWFSREAPEEITPIAITRPDYRDFDRYCAEIGTCPGVPEEAPASTFFCIDEARNRAVGAVNIRHRLNARLLRCGGHIGDGVRPTDRGQGIGTQMVALALEECGKLGIRRVLMVCDKDNIASAKTILRNGGVLENEIEEDGFTEQRYWITLP